MVKIYVRLIQKGAITIKDVPLQNRTEVLAVLAALDLDQSGNIL
ncbi:CD1375 family protein [Paenibacillus sp. LS1]|nr:CD1375 family protein [Paenibacillus sp. LS1]MCW3793512.1 CD1375 family protein [Paenibacillus sp. LS1]